MKFDRSKVVDGLCDNLEQWIGYEGYFADSIQALKSYVERDLDSSTLIEVEKNRSGFFYFRNSNDDISWLFYPANPPEKKKLVPFDNCQEVIEWYCEREGVELLKNQHPFVWIRNKNTGIDFLITAINSAFVYIQNQWITLEELFYGFTLIDGTSIGKEV